MAKAKLIPRMRAAAQRVEQTAKKQFNAGQQRIGMAPPRAAQAARCAGERDGRELWRTLVSLVETTRYRLFERLTGLTEEHPSPVETALTFVARAIRLPAPRVASSITVQRTRAEVLCAILQFEELQRFLRSIARVELAESEEIADLAARTERGTATSRRGFLSLTPAPCKRGTEVKAVLPGAEPCGRLARVLSVALAAAPERRLRGDLRRIRQWIETGELPTTAGQPSGRKVD
jgi:hypothetical protein